MKAKDFKQYKGKYIKCGDEFMHIKSVVVDHVYVDAFGPKFCSDKSLVMPFDIKGHMDLAYQNDDNDEYELADEIVEISQEKFLSELNKLTSKIINVFNK